MREIKCGKPDLKSQIGNNKQTLASVSETIFLALSVLITDLYFRFMTARGGWGALTGQAAQDVRAQVRDEDKLQLAHADTLLHTR